MESSSSASNQRIRAGLPWQPVNTTALVSPWAEEECLVGLDEPEDEILEQPDQDLAMGCWQTELAYRGGKPPRRRPRWGQPAQAGPEGPERPGSCRPASPGPDAAAVRPSAALGSRPAHTPPWHPRRTARWPNAHAPARPSATMACRRAAS